MKQHARTESSRTQFLNEWLTHSEKFLNKAFLDRGLAIGSSGIASISIGDYSLAPDYLHMHEA